MTFNGLIEQSFQIPGPRCLICLYFLCKKANDIPALEAVLERESLLNLLGVSTVLAAL